MPEATRVELHPHSAARLIERGASVDEVIQTVRTGEQFPAKHNRTGFRLNFAYNKPWNNRTYAMK